MESLEKIRQPEIKTDDLLSILDSVEWKDGYIFTFNGTEFYICIVSKEDLAEAEEKGDLSKFGEPAEYFESTYVRGFDIYLHDTIPESKRKRILFHEILEANLKDKGFPGNEAHKITVEEEEKVFGIREN